jgi:hypothetical protein
MSKHLDDLIDWEDWANELLDERRLGDDLPEEAGSARDASMRQRIASQLPAASEHPLKVAGRCACGAALDLALPRAGGAKLDDFMSALSRWIATHPCALAEVANVRKEP